MILIAAFATMALMPISRWQPTFGKGVSVMYHVYSGFTWLASAKRRSVREMLRPYARRISLCLAAVVIAFLAMAGSQSHVTAKPQASIGPFNVSQFDCNSFYFGGQSTNKSGYAAVRIWVGSTSGTPIVDSYVAGYPSYYTPFDTNPNFNGDFRGGLTFPTQPNGTTLIARVYRALNATPGSWDGGNVIDTTIQCTYGIYQGYGTLFCSHFAFGGRSFPGSGYAAIRIWVNSVGGTTLVD